MSKGYLYILRCSDGTFYTGSTLDLEKRLQEHQDGKGANHTKKRLPVELVYIEEFQRIDDAFYREKQVQGWSRNKKIALIGKNFNVLPKLSECKNASHYKEWLRLRSATEDVSNSSQEKQFRLRSATDDKSNSIINHKLDFSNNNTNNQSDSIKSNFKLSNSVAERSRSYSNGKLLITGEYVVLDGALSLAIPTRFGQSLTVEPFNKPKLIWKSLDKNNNLWFEDEFSLQNGMLKQPQHDNEISTRLFQILNTAKQINPEFLMENIGFKVESNLTFPRDWGLGSSSTLINNIANWAKIDAYNLLKLTFGGSGYDIACAQHDSAITFQITNKDSKTLNQVEDDKPMACQINFNPEFKDCLYFVHLNRKQNSREGIEHYKKNKSNISNEISEISEITSKIIHCKHLNEFEGFINRHEEIISNIIKHSSVKDLLFKDFQGSIKSLGAWGGDFILATSKVDPTTYFKSKGYETVIPFKQMVLK